MFSSFQVKKPFFPFLSFVFALLFSLGSSFSVEAHEAELNSVRAKIIEQGAKWKAQETAVSRLAQDVRRGRLGLNKRAVLPAEIFSGAVTVAAAPVTYSAPASLDYRAYGYVTSVKDQGTCGSCWAFASTAALESQLAMRGYGALNLSEQTMVSCDTQDNGCRGGAPQYAAAFLKNTGVPVEACFPYAEANSSCSRACSNWRDNTYKVSNWQMIASSNPTVGGIKDALVAYGPLTTTMNVYSDFFYYSSGVYSYSWGSYQGGHVVLIVGYNDSERAFIVKNSWGTNWGMSGYFKIAYSQVTNGLGFGQYTIAYAAEAAKMCAYAVSPTGVSATAAGGASTIAVSTDSGCAWTAASNVTWASVTSGAKGTGNGTVSYKVEANASPTSRTGTMTVAGKPFTITQAGAPVCTYAISPTGVSATAAGGSSTIKVTTQTGCPWTAGSNVSWASVTGGSSGTGSGTVSYTVSANTATTARTGTMTVAGQTFTIAQEAAAQTCTFEISPTSVSVIAAGGSATITVTTQPGCKWKAASNVSWASVTAGSSGKGSGTVSYKVSANKSASGRTGTMTIAGKTFLISQAGKQVCTYAISPTSVSVTAAGGRSAVAVTTQTGCPWTAASHVSWASVTGGSSGMGSGTVSYQVNANTSTSKRSGTMTIAGKTFAIVQAAATPSCTYALTPTSVSAKAAANGGSIIVTTQTNCPWTAVSNASWVTIRSGTKGKGGGTVTYNMMANTSAYGRSGTISIAGQVVTIFQEARASSCTYALSQSNRIIPPSGGAGALVVSTQGGCQWTAVSSVSWARITQGASGSGAGLVYYNVDANPSREDRIGMMIIAGKTFAINQLGWGRARTR